MKQSHLFLQDCFPQIDFKGGINNSIFGNNPRDQSVRSDVEGNVSRFRFNGGNAFAVEFEPEHLLGVAFFDRNQITICQRKIDS